MRVSFRKGTKSFLSADGEREADLYSAFNMTSQSKCFTLASKKVWRYLKGSECTFFGTLFPIISMDFVALPCRPRSSRATAFTVAHKDYAKATLQNPIYKPDHCELHHSPVDNRAQVVPLKHYCC